jgi:hypothetical protein
MDNTAQPGEEMPVLAVVGTSADVPPPGLPAQWPGYRIRFIPSGSQLATDAADAEIVFLWKRVDWLRESWAGATGCAGSPPRPPGSTGCCFPG